MNLSANASHSNYTPEILFCGGSTINDKLKPIHMSSQTPASKQCSRMKLDAAGIAGGWKVEKMPGPRLMIDAILKPDGNVLLINGAATGVSTFSTFNIRYSSHHAVVYQLAAFNAVPDMVGSSNADHPGKTTCSHLHQHALNSWFCFN
jgi:hypothetical protein